jgi:hypothetical protein
MSDENQEKQTERDDKELRELEATKEYKEWYESLFAIIGYTSNEEHNDEDLARELIADHLSASFELQNGLEKAKHNAKHRAMKEMQDDWLLDNCGQ